jgi:hypothetical protein
VLKIRDFDFPAIQGGLLLVNRDLFFTDLSFSFDQQNILAFDFSLAKRELSFFLSVALESSLEVLFLSKVFIAQIHYFRFQIFDFINESNLLFPECFLDLLNGCSEFTILLCKPCEFLIFVGRDFFREHLYF